MIRKPVIAVLLFLSALAYSSLYAAHGELFGRNAILVGGSSVARRVQSSLQE